MNNDTNNSLTDNLYCYLRSDFNFLDGLGEKRGEMRSMRMKSDINSIDDTSERSREIRGRISRIRRKMQGSQEKVDQYSNNILFIAKGKKGDSLRNQIQKEIDKESRMIDEFRKKIRELDDILRNPDKLVAKEEEEKPSEAFTTLLSSKLS